MILRATHFFLHFLFNLTYFLIDLGDAGVGAAGHALVLRVRRVSDDSSFLQFHSGFYCVSVHARAMFFNSMSVHRRPC